MFQPVNDQGLRTLTPDIVASTRRWRRQRMFGFGVMTALCALWFGMYFLDYREHLVLPLMLMVPVTVAVVGLWALSVYVHRKPLLLFAYSDGSFVKFMTSRDAEGLTFTAVPAPSHKTVGLLLDFRHERIYLAHRSSESGDWYRSVSLRMRPIMTPKGQLDALECLVKVGKKSPWYRVHYTYLLLLLQGDKRIADMPSELVLMELGITQSYLNSQRYRVSQLEQLNSELEERVKAAECKASFEASEALRKVREAEERVQQGSLKLAAVRRDGAEIVDLLLMALLALTIRENSGARQRVIRMRIANHYRDKLLAMIPSEAQHLPKVLLRMLAEPAFPLRVSEAQMENSLTGDTRYVSALDTVAGLLDVMPFDHLASGASIRRDTSSGANTRE